MSLFKNTRVGDVEPDDVGRPCVEVNESGDDNQSSSMSGKRNGISDVEIL